MPSADPDSRRERRETALAVSIMFFFGALLCMALGWAEGMRHDIRIVHIPATGGWLAAAGVCAAIGVLFLLWSRDMSDSPPRPGA